MIAESWLSERTDAGSRGRVFGVYTMVNLAATTAGQMVLTLGDPAGYFFFVLAAIVYCLALLPTAISASASPAALVSVKLDLRGLWRNSPVAAFAVVMVGLSNGSFGALSAVYASRIGLGLSDVALFASVPLLAGALAQYPIGMLSDRFDRRLILIATALLALTADLLFVFAGLEGAWVNLALAALFGVSVFTMYPLIVAHAHDHAAPGSFIQISGGLLLLFGVGSIAGPTIAGLAMTSLGTNSLFMVTASAHVLVILFALWRMRRSAAVPTEDKTAFIVTPSTRATTPETAVIMDPESMG